jgi:hypothetical protein
VVDYGLARRATLTALRGTGPTCRDDVCDAHPYLRLAARHHGEQSGLDCPVCARERLVHVSYVYGDSLGRYAGRVKVSAELEVMAREVDEFRVYVVEVCTRCGWNHLVRSYVLGTGVADGDAEVQAVRR